MRTFRIALALFTASLATTSLALEPRTWIILDGRIIQAELQKVSGSLVSILDTAG